MNGEDVKTLVNLTYAMGSLLQARIELEGMIAENRSREYMGEAPAYVEKHFEELRDKHGINQNSIVSTIYPGR